MQSNRIEIYRVREFFPENTKEECDLNSCETAEYDHGSEKFPKNCNFSRFLNESSVDHLAITFEHIILYDILYHDMNKYKRKTKSKIRKTKQESE